jgi:hypothetical protein
MFNFLLVWIVQLLLLFSIVAVMETDDGFSIMDEKSRLVIVLSVILLVAAPEAFGEKKKECKTPRPHCNWTMHSVWSIFQELGPTYVRQAYQMD